MIFAAIFAPWLAPMDPAQQHLEDKRTPPGSEYLLGADEFGRDILSRIIYGSRVALFVAVAAVAIAMLLGVTLGIAAGFMGGWLDNVLMRVTDIMLCVSIPVACHCHRSRTWHRSPEHNAWPSVSGRCRPLLG